MEHNRKDGHNPAPQGHTQPNIRLEHNARHSVVKIRNIALAVRMLGSFAIRSLAEFFQYTWLEEHSLVIFLLGFLQPARKPLEQLQI